MVVFYECLCESSPWGFVLVAVGWESAKSQVMEASLWNCGCDWGDKMNHESRLPGLNLLLDDHQFALNIIFLICKMGMPVSRGWEYYMRVLQMLLCQLVNSMAPYSSLYVNCLWVLKACQRLSIHISSCTPSLLLPSLPSSVLCLFVAFPPPLPPSHSFLP